MQLLHHSKATGNARAMAVGAAIPITIFADHTGLKPRDSALVAFENRLQLCKVSLHHRQCRVVGGRIRHVIDHSYKRLRTRSADGGKIGRQLRQIAGRNGRAITIVLEINDALTKAAVGSPGKRQLTR